MAFINDMEYYVKDDTINLRSTQDWIEIKIDNLPEFIKDLQEDLKDLTILAYKLKQQGLLK